MNQEETVWDIQNRVIEMEKKLDKLMTYVLPDKEDKSKCTVSARLSTSCEQPSNHGRIGKMPRSREGCFKDKETNTS